MFLNDQLCPPYTILSYIIVVCTFNCPFLLDTLGSRSVRIGVTDPRFQIWNAKTELLVCIYHNYEQRIGIWDLETKMKKKYGKIYPKFCF